MKKTLIFPLILAFWQLSAQTDLLILQKNGANIQSFSAGMEINLETIYHQWFDGMITAIRHDSLFINGFPFHYKEIEALRIPRKKWHSKGVGHFLMIAGGGVLFLGAVNGLYRGDPARSWYTATSFITAGSLLLAGYLLSAWPYRSYPLGKTYSLQYLPLGEVKMPASQMP
jgi:hypothetical protein